MFKGCLYDASTKDVRDANCRRVNPILVLKVDIPIDNKDPFEGL